MHDFNRRAFLGSSLAAWMAPSAGGLLWAADKTKEKAKSSKPAAPAPAKTPAPAKIEVAAPTETLLLTWRQDPTTTMVIQWLGPNTGDVPSVEFAEYGKSAEWRKQTPKTKPYPLTELKVYRTELTKLKPGTEYQFRLGADKTIHRFRTMPAKATDTFSFISGGDCGTNAHALANNRLAARQNPMFTFIGGDLGYDNGRDAKTSVDFVRNYTREMIDAEGRRIPLVVCLGNHEVDGGYGRPRENAPFFFALHDGLYDERSYGTLDFGDYLSLVLLDSGHISDIDGEQTSWLEDTLRERVERPHLVSAYHVPSYPSYRPMDGLLGTGTGALSRKHWVPLFEKYNVDFVLEHHDHTFKRTHPLKDGLINANGISYLGDGSWGQLRTPHEPEERPYLAAVNKAYHMTLHRLEGERRFHVALEETGRIVDIHMTTKRPRRIVGRSAQT
jgi:hypothetical protein